MIPHRQRCILQDDERHGIYAILYLHLCNIDVKFLSIAKPTGLLLSVKRQLSIIKLSHGWRPTDTLRRIGSKTKFLVMSPLDLLPTNSV
jgi:hypothetical protein